MTLEQYNNLCAKLEELTGLPVFGYENNTEIGSTRIELEYNRMIWDRPKNTVRYLFEISLIGDIQTVQSMLAYSEDEINFDKLFTLPMPNSNEDPIFINTNDWFSIEYNTDDTERNEENDRLEIKKTYNLIYQVNL